MKNKIHFLILLISSFIIGCNNDNSSQLDSKNDLILKLINTPEIHSSNFSKMIIISKTEYCEDFDCETYFQDYKEQIKIYSKAEVFMRAPSNYIEIEKLDNEKGIMHVRKITKKGSEKIEIKI